MSEGYKAVIERLNLTISSRDVQDAVMAYDAVLKSTVDVFGIDVDPSVMIAAIEAGSYIAWRGIMGPKQSDSMPIKTRRI